MNIGASCRIVASIPDRPGGSRGRVGGAFPVSRDFAKCDATPRPDQLRPMSHATRQIEAHLQYGRRLHGAGRLAEAGQVYQQVLAAAPRHAEAQDMMGVLLLQMGRPAEALPWFRNAIANNANAADFHVHQAHALLALGRAAEAATASRAALRLKRGHAEAHQMLGRALTETADYAGALKAFQDAVRLKPDLLDGLNDLGTALHHANRLDEAARTLARAAAREPNEPGILLNLSSVLKSLGRFQESETRLTAALRLAPADPRVLYKHGLLMLLLGRYTEGWPGWEQRFRAGAVPDRGLAKPAWRGEPLNGRTLLVHAEQGLGDTIQFCRFPLPTDGPVVLEVQPRIARLLRGLCGAPRILPMGEQLPAFDLSCPLMSLPVVLGTTLDNIPRGVPYLAAEPDAVALWRSRLGAPGSASGSPGKATPRGVRTAADRSRWSSSCHWLPCRECG